MLPKSYHCPTELLQVKGRIAVPPLVFLKFGLPPQSVAFGTGAVIGAAMPEASVDKDGHTCPREGDVDRAPWSPGHRPSNTKPEPIGMQQPPEGLLGLRVTPSLRPHPR